MAKDKKGDKGKEGKEDPKGDSNAKYHLRIIPKDMELVFGADAELPLPEVVTLDGFTLRREMLVHFANQIDMVYDADDNTLRCNFPGCTSFKADPKSGNVNAHINNHLGRRLPCGVRDCDADFTDRSGLTKHIKKFHRITSKYMCPQCCQLFDDRRKCGRHLRDVHEIRGTEEVKAVDPETKRPIRRMPSRRVASEHDRIQVEKLVEAALSYYRRASTSPTPELASPSSRTSSSLSQEISTPSTHMSAVEAPIVAQQQYAGPSHAGPSSRPVEAARRAQRQATPYHLAVDPYVVQGDTLDGPPPIVPRRERVRRRPHRRLTGFPAAADGAVNYPQAPQVQEDPTSAIPDYNQGAMTGFPGQWGQFGLYWSTGQFAPTLNGGMYGETADTPIVPTHQYGTTVPQDQWAWPQTAMTLPAHQPQPPYQGIALHDASDLQQAPASFTWPDYQPQQPQPFSGHPQTAEIDVAEVEQSAVTALDWDIGDINSYINFPPSEDDGNGFYWGTGQNGGPA